jgi:competence protein ComEC
LVSAAALAAVAAVLAAGWTDRSLLVLLVCAGALGVAGAVLLHRRTGRRSRGPMVGSLWGTAVLVVVFAVVGLRADQDLRGLESDLPDRVSGTAEMGSDPETSRFGTSFELVAGGRRWSATAARGVEGAVAGLGTGDRIHVEGRVERFERAPREWVLSRHLAGRVEVTAVDPLADTRPWFRAANAVHEVLERGAGSMDPDQRSLYLGLVVGDDRGQSELTQFHFRASGLTHLLAVSGQNLVFVLAVLAPLSRRITYRARWVMGVSAVVAFVIITRAEPSVLRAATMAILGLSATIAGRRVPAARLVGLAVVGLLVADPMLVHSVGFRLSVAATLGLVLLTRRIEMRLIGPKVIRLPLAVTLAAQLGAVPVMVTTFGNVSLVAVPANVLAEPAAGLVMTLGLTSGLVSGLVREEVAWMLQAPVRVAVSWVDQVAAMGAELAIPPSGVIAWAVIVGASLWSVHLWRTRGSAMVGRVTAVAVIPMVVFLRPPLPGTGEVSSVEGGGELRGTCAGWLLHLGDTTVDERTGVELLESLWRMGVTRVALVTVEVAMMEDAVIEEGQQRVPTRVLVGQQQGGSEMVARELHAPLAAVTTGVDVTDLVRGIADGATDNNDDDRDPAPAVARESVCS